MPPKKRKASQQRQPSKGLYTWLLPTAIIILLGCIAYGNSVDAPFVFDDLETIQRNAIIRFGDYFNVLEFFRTRSLLFGTFAFNYWLGGQSVLGYHILNLLLHILNGILIFAIALRIFRKRAMDATIARLYALFAAAFFLAHPLQTESVTYISGRSELLSTFFYLLGFAAFVATPEDKIGFRTGLAVLGLMLLGFGGKETVITLPAAIVLYDYLFIAKGKATSILRRWRFYLTFALAGALSSYYLLAKQVINLETQSEHLPRWYYFLTQQRVIIRYIRLIFFPTGLNFIYSFRPSVSILEPSVLFSFLLILGMIFLGWRCRATKPIFSFSIFWFFITLSPTSSIIPIPDIIFEHRVYLPLAGVCLAFPFLMEWLVRTATGAFRMRLVLGLAISILVVFSIATVLRNEVWRDDVRLFSDAVAKSPQIARPYNLLMMAHMNRGQEEKAISVAKLASENLPGGRVSFLDTIGNLYMRLGRPEQAVTYFRSSGDEAVRVKASTEFIANSFNNLGVAYMALARTFDQSPGQNTEVKTVEQRETALRDARESFRKSLEANPNNLRVLDSYVNVSLALGELPVLDRDLVKRLVANPNDFSSNYSLAASLSLQSRYVDSLRYFQRAEELDKSKTPPDQPAAAGLDKSSEVLYFNFAFALAKAGDLDQAVSKYMEALRIDPLFSEAYYNLALLHVQKSDYDSAINNLSQILQQEPKNVRANMKLAEIYAYQGKLPLAKQHLQQILQVAPQDSQALALLQRIGP